MEVQEKMVQVQYLTLLIFSSDLRILNLNIFDRTSDSMKFTNYAILYLLFKLKIVRHCFSAYISFHSFSRLFLKASNLRSKYIHTISDQKIFIEFWYIEISFREFPFQVEKRVPWIIYFHRACNKHGLLPTFILSQRSEFQLYTNFRAYEACEVARF